MRIRIKVTPNSKIEAVIEEGDMFLVRVKEPAKEGKANRAVIKLLADYFGVPQRQIAISSGFSSRNKIIDITK
ncbi:MAG: DUF167 domain-containing protein [Dehalococcoidia bacterium]|nr:DUF167 domain-containing protein [Dehalococcoidia bacterium]